MISLVELIVSGWSLVASLSSNARLMKRLRGKRGGN